TPCQTSYAVHGATATLARRSGKSRSSGSGCGPSPLRLLLPAAVRRLLPVRDRVAAALELLPAGAGARQRLGIGAVEQEHDAFVAAEIGRLGTVGKEADRRAVGIVSALRQPHRLLLGPAVGGGAVREERIVAVRPQVGVERLQAFRRPD